MIFDPNPPANSFPAPWASAFGEDKYGLWQAFTINGARQVMRWMLPGKFMMGSPQDELQRDDDETLHQVTLSQGYWLADTACPQALWRAVMGDNPSHFEEDSACPVETVSWDDCQVFLEKLNQQIPQLKPRLPTEAQWEYACRAGSNTPFSWGKDLNTNQANYDGNLPYGSGAKGEYREATLPVLSFEPNSWGLYQMHGNVLEWCKDWFVAYANEPCMDPQGPSKGQDRVLRGGSWYGNGEHLRCACRYRRTPDLRYHYYGLRLAGG